ncbi:DUF2817 domain-containing protein [Microcystis elabens FACHB-917]|nr:DUF2817 domain-containing protein [Microcystis elabens FACHB-917]
MDAAALGAVEPESLLLLISGTHGVEGLAGSGCQVGVLLDVIHGGRRHSWSLSILEKILTEHLDPACRGLGG